MPRKSYKKRSAKKTVKRHSSSKRSSSRKSSSKVRGHYRTVRKTRVKSHYRMKGMGHLLQMYGGASAELEAEHNACLVKYKELMGVHAAEKQVWEDLKSNGASKSEINEQASKANDIRAQIEDLVEGAGKCKEKQAALLESLKEVTHNVTEQLNDEVQSGGGFADWGAKLDSASAKLSASAKAAGSKFSSGMKSIGSKLSSGMKSVGESIKNKYNEYKEVQQAKKDAQEKIQLRKLLAKHGQMQEGGGFADWGAKLDSASAKLSSGMKSVGSKLSSGMKSVGSKLSSGMKSVGESIKNKYNEYKEVQQAKKDAQEKIQLRKLLAKHGSSVSSVSSVSSENSSE